MTDQGTDRGTDTALAWRVEAVCFNAFPSLKQAILDGWLLRFSRGVSRRANSANPLHPDHAAPEYCHDPMIRSATPS